MMRDGISIAALLTVALFAAACSGGSERPSVADVGSPSPEASGGAEGSELAYSRCMRENGITAFPDPNADGELQVNAGPGTGIDPDDPQYKAADETCKPLLPNGGEQAPIAELDREKILEYAQCMRDEGITEFPDPNPDGGIALDVKPGSNLDPNSPLHQAADEACRHLMPGGGEGGSVNSVDE